jgi:flagellar hook-basal body complex protein FliE
MTVVGPQISLLLPHAADAVGPESGVSGLGGAAPSGVPDGTFAATLEHAIAGTNADLNAAGIAGEEFARGARDDIHGTMIALSKADIELRFASNVRNKVVDAFYELWRMQI